MFSFEYAFYPKQDVNQLDYYDQVLSTFLAVLCRNGQLTDQHWNIIKDQNTLKLFCMAPEEDSLDKKYYNQYCYEYLERVCQMSVQPPDYKLIGPSLGSADCCTCSEPSSYILFTNFVANYPPISCGDCNLPVPLYKLPKLNNELEYSSILNWESTYQACDVLFINSGVGERFGYRQISQVTSQLSVEGLGVCKELSQKVGKPFYYFLHKHYRAPGNKCPLCGEVWKLDKPLFNLFAYKCDDCRLLADKP